MSWPALSELSQTWTLSICPSQSLSTPSVPTGSFGSFVSNAHGLTSESWSLQSPLHVVQPSPSSSKQLLLSGLAKPSNSNDASVPEASFVLEPVP